MNSLSKIIRGDVVEHTNTHRRGCVVEVGRTHPDGSIEYRVRPAQDAHYDIQFTEWNSAHLRRVPHRDPYRRYLALIDIEEDPAKQARRQHPPEASRRHWAQRSRMSGPWLPGAVWDKLYWRLSNLRQRDPNGAYVSYDLGRVAWERAAIDCLRRRERAARWWYTGTERQSAEKCTCGAWNTLSAVHLAYCKATGSQPKSMANPTLDEKLSITGLQRLYRELESTRGFHVEARQAELINAIPVLLQIAEASKALEPELACLQGPLSLRLRKVLGTVRQ
jgi:hypothetical protein